MESSLFWGISLWCGKIGNRLKQADYEKRLHYAAENTDLPDEPDMKTVQDLVMIINERVVRNEI